MGEGDARQVRHSLHAPRRFLTRLAGAEHFYVDYLRRHFGVVAVATRRLHVKGRRASVVAALA